MINPELFFATDSSNNENKLRTRAKKRPKVVLPDSSSPTMLLHVSSSASPYIIHMKMPNLEEDKLLSKYDEQVISSNLEQALAVAKSLSSSISSLASEANILENKLDAMDKDIECNISSLQKWIKDQSKG